MSDILIVVATPGEAVKVSGNVQVLVTGAGIAATTYQLTKALQKQSYRLVVNLGICGTLDTTIEPGSIVRIISDRFADFGAEDDNEFLPASKIGLVDPNQFPFQNNILTPSLIPGINSLSNIPSRPGITVQKATGSTYSASWARSKFGPVMESMEGAAVFYCAMMESVPCLQIRAVSNKVEKRAREQWKITEALEALHHFAGQLIPEITQMKF
jgi:futalosine hydrolase